MPLLLSFIAYVLEGGTWDLPTYPQQALPADCHGPAPSSELRPLEAALTQELWLKTPALVPLEWGDCEACWSLTGSRRIESLWLP